MEKNILHAFEKTGIWPQDPNMVIKTIHKLVSESKPLTPTQTDLFNLKILLTSKAICRAHLIYHQNPQTPVFNKILEVNIRLAGQVTIQKHALYGLQETLKQEKKKEEKGKKT